MDVLVEDEAGGCPIDVVEARASSLFDICSVSWSSAAELHRESNANATA
jgi:hypothetical protein